MGKGDAEEFETAWTKQCTPASTFPFAAGLFLVMLLAAHAALQWMTGNGVCGGDIHFSELLLMDVLILLLYLVKVRGNMVCRRDYQSLCCSGCPTAQSEAQI
jgi:hypothetical protein